MFLTTELKQLRTLTKCCFCIITLLRSILLLCMDFVAVVSLSYIKQSLSGSQVSSLALSPNTWADLGIPLKFSEYDRKVKLKQKSAPLCFTRKGFVFLLHVIIGKKCCLSSVCPCFTTVCKSVPPANLNLRFALQNECFWCEATIQEAWPHSASVLLIARAVFKRKQGTS